jgi:hypothetical protein
MFLKEVVVQSCFLSLPSAKQGADTLSQSLTHELIHYRPLSFFPAFYNVHVQPFAFYSLCISLSSFFSAPKVAERCNSVDPPILRKLRSCTN